MSMPEGPEVRLLCAQLASVLVGSRLTRIEIRGGPLATSTQHRYVALRHGLEGWTPCIITAIQPHGKTMFWETDGDQVLVSHLGMEGTFSENLTAHSLVALQFEGRTVYFNDTRRFGTLGVRNRKEVERDRKHMGPDVLNFDDWPEVVDRILANRSSKLISTELLNQNFLAGIGNYLRCDILYHAHLSPHRTFVSLTEDERTALMFAVLDVPAQAWRAARATQPVKPDRHGRRFAPEKARKDRTGTEGAEGRYVMKVYQRKISIGGHPVHRLTQAGRTVHWSPAEQS